MATYRIAQASRILAELISGLDQAYWEASSIERKDFFYDLISAVYGEVSEISKLSIQDHDLEYETITRDFRAAYEKLSQLRTRLDEYVLHSSTAARLEVLIDECVALPCR
jgi:antirestriction protein